MYHQKLVASIKCNNKILRENGDEVYLPFGSEYSILIKNLNTVDCKLTIFIDGDNALDGRNLILAAGSTTEIERFINNNNLDSGNKFKFIEKTQQISNFRGDKLEDSLVRIEYQFEKPMSLFNGNASTQLLSKGRERGIDCYAASMNCGISVANLNHFQPQANSGITVAGSRSDQQFGFDTKFRTYENEKNNIILKLIGGEQIKEPITVKHTPTCITCGKKNKASSKFCSNCGTALQLF